MMERQDQTDTQSTRATRDKSLFAYSLAAGVAAMGAADDAEGVIMYSGVQDIAINQGASQAINFDGDDFQDIQFKNYIFDFDNYMGAFIYGAPGKMIATQSGLWYVTSIAPDTLIDSASTGAGNFVGSMAYGAANPNGEFDSASGAFVGLSFPIGGNTEEFIHYGWVRVTIDQPTGTFIINDWAYNSEQGAPIRAGQTMDDPALPGDTDGDGDIDDADLGTSFANYTGPLGAGIGTKTAAQGDTDGDGDVDDADLGTSFSGYTGPLSAAVPEPGSLGLLAIGAFGLATYRGRHRRS